MSEQDITQDSPEPGTPGVIADDRKNTDRRKQNATPPDGVDRRRWQDRRKLRAGEGRERYLDMVQRERAMFIEQGVSRSTEQLLDMAGAPNSSELEEEGIRDRATGDQLRSVLPVQAWLPLSIHL